MGKKRSQEQKDPRKRGRDAPAFTEEETLAKKLLSSNKFASLPEVEADVNPSQQRQQVEVKERPPPFYTKGFPDNFRQDFNILISKGLKATIRLCSDGYKVIVPNTPNYHAVEEYFKRKSVEYFTHDLPNNKPFKVLLRGLYDMEVEELKSGLVEVGLKPTNVFKIARKNTEFRYRDQLYLVHLAKNTTSLAELKNIRALFNIIVQWDRYTPVHRDVTQCMNCLNFGHGTRNCHLKSRCPTCGGNHEASECQPMEEPQVKCVNCGRDHYSTSRGCPKRKEYIERRKLATTRNQASRRTRPPPALTESQFPALQPRVAPNLLPLPLNNQQAPYNSSTNQAASYRHSAQHRLTAAAAQPSQGSFVAPGLPYSSVVSDETDDSPFTSQELVTLVAEVINILRTCRTRAEQLHAAVSLINKYGP